MRSSTLIPALVLFATGCSTFLVNGARVVDPEQELPKPRITYRSEDCQLSDGTTIEGAEQLRFDVIDGEDGIMVFERYPDGGGTLITNRWLDKDGVHLFLWLTQKNKGWEYVIPVGGRGQAERRIYVRAVVLTGIDGSKRPASEPAAVCPLVEDT